MDNNTPDKDSVLQEKAPDAASLWQQFRYFITHLFDIREETDRSETVEAVRKDISFKGHNAWILIFSIMIASVGLNVNSTAVIIGAMLISPLMGPIVGVGLGVATNDTTMMKRSLVNLAVMMVISITTAFLYFSISPLKELTPELEARTYPTILDVLIAIFGGLALIVAKTKKGTILSVITGVAIATALMPPLCTAGYGLAVGNSGYLLGALYLFFINSVFIALAAFVVSKLLRFRMVRYENQKRRRRNALIAAAIGIAVLIPSVITFLRLLDETIYKQSTQRFVENVIDYPGANIIDFSQDYKTKIIDVYLLGEAVPPEMIQSWQTRLETEEGLEGCKLVIHQGQGGRNQDPSVIETEYISTIKALGKRDLELSELREEITRIKTEADPLKEIFEEVGILYPDLQNFTYGPEIAQRNNQRDTLLTVNLVWPDTMSDYNRIKRQAQLGQWLKLRSRQDTLVIRGVTAPVSTQIIDEKVGE